MSVDPQPDQPAGGVLLLAGLDLLEATFRRTVILLARHSLEEGALGYILNRPVGKRVRDLLPSGEFASIGDVAVFFGGPVAQDHLTFASLHWDDESRGMVLQTHLSAAQANAMRLEGFEIRGFVGYSGWAPGQLEGELEARAWEVQRPVCGELLHYPAGELWPRLIRGLGPLHRIAADMPDDLSLN